MDAESSESLFTKAPGLECLASRFQLRDINKRRRSLNASLVMLCGVRCSTITIQSGLRLSGEIVGRVKSSEGSAYFCCIKSWLLNEPVLILTRYTRNYGITLTPGALGERSKIDPIHVSSDHSLYYRSHIMFSFRLLYAVYMGARLGRAIIHKALPLYNTVTSKIWKPILALSQFLWSWIYWLNTFIPLKYSLI